MARTNRSSHFLLIVLLVIGGCKEDPDPPVTDFTFNVSPTDPLEVFFTNTTTGATSYEWNFGDGSTSFTENPSHTYNASGTYNVVLSATGEGGTTNQEQRVTVTAPPPRANFSYTASGLIVDFNNSSTDATSYSWDFGDGTTSTVENPSKTYGRSGRYNVTLTATGSGGSDQSNSSVDISSGSTSVSLEVTNLLYAEVAIYNNESFVGSVDARSTGGFSIRSFDSNDVRWEIIREVSSGCGISLGQAGLGGTFTESNPSGTWGIEIDNIVQSTTFFAPFLDNENGNSVYWFINRNNSQSWDSDNCVVLPNTTNVFLGYFRYVASESEDVVVDITNPISGRYSFWNASSSNFSSGTGEFNIRLTSSASLSRSQTIENAGYYYTLTGEKKLVQRMQPFDVTRYNTISREDH